MTKKRALEEAKRVANTSGHTMKVYCVNKSTDFYSFCTEDYFRVYDLEGTVTNVEEVTKDPVKYVLALTRPLPNNGREVAGYYVADDEDVTDDLKKAVGYTTLEAAQAEQTMVHSSWDLEIGERFAIVDICSENVSLAETLAERIRLRLKRAAIDGKLEMERDRAFVVALQLLVDCLDEHFNGLV